MQWLEAGCCELCACLCMNELPINCASVC